MPMKTRTKTTVEERRKESSISTPFVSARTNEIQVTPGELDVSLTKSSSQAAVVVSSSSPLTEIYESTELQLDWDNEVSFHVAENALHLRRYRRWSQAKVASLMKTSQPHIARIEGGSENITLDTLKRLVTALQGRLRLSIEPAEANLPRLPAWWNSDGLGLTSRQPWILEGARTAQSDSGARLVGSLWSSEGTTSADPNEMLALAAQAEEIITYGEKETS